MFAIRLANMGKPMGVGLETAKTRTNWLLLADTMSSVCASTGPHMKAQTSGQIWREQPSSGAAESQVCRGPSRAANARPRPS